MASMGTSMHSEPSAGQPSGTREDNLSGQAESIIGKMYADPDFNVRRLAESLGVSLRHLQRKLRNSKGVTPSTFLKDYRLRRSLDLLESNMKVADVARGVGFSSHAYFSSCFRQQFGITPSRLQSLKRLDRDL